MQNTNDDMYCVVEKDVIKFLKQYGSSLPNEKIDIRISLIRNNIFIWFGRNYYLDITSECSRIGGVFSESAEDKQLLQTFNNICTYFEKYIKDIKKKVT